MQHWTVWAQSRAGCPDGGTCPSPSLTDPWVLGRKRPFRQGERARQVSSARWGFPSGCELVAAGTAIPRAGNRGCALTLCAERSQALAALSRLTPVTSQRSVTKIPILQKKETKAQRGQTTSPKMHSREQRGWGRHSGLSLPVQPLPSSALGLAVDPPSRALPHRPLGTSQAGILPQA